MKKIAKDIEGLLRAFGTRVTGTGIGIMECGTAESAEEIQPFVSFLRSRETDNLDLCIYLRPKGNLVEIAGDLVLCDGSIISTMDPAEFDQQCSCERTMLEPVIRFLSEIEPIILQHIGSESAS